MTARHLFDRVDKHAVLCAAADEIWHSIQKYSGDPTSRNSHPIRCGCTYCD